MTPSVLASVSAVLTWAHLTGRYTMHFGRRSTGAPIPDWLVAALFCAVLGYLAWEIWSRVSRRQAAARWSSDVARHAQAVPAAEAAERLADGFGLDPEAFRTLRFERLRRAEQDQGHPLPWIWIDPNAIELLTASAPSRLTRIRLHSSFLTWEPGIWSTLLTLALIIVMGIIGGFIMGVTPRSVMIATAAAVALVLVVIACVLYQRRSLALAFIGPRAIAMQADRELAHVDPSRAYIAITRRRVRTRHGYHDLDSIRWWFLLPGRRALFADDVPLPSTPWRDEILEAILEAQSVAGPRSACPACGYPTQGLPSATCPECGQPLSIEST